VNRTFKIGEEVVRIAGAYGGMVVGDKAHVFMVTADGLILEEYKGRGLGAHAFTSIEPVSVEEEPVAEPLTKGHLVNNGGIRAHSAGEFFPYIIRGKGVWDEDSWRWQVLCPDSTIAGSFKQHEHSQAEALAKLLKVGNA